MTAPNHADISRDLGRIEGKTEAMGARLDRLEKIIEDGFDKINERLSGLEANENQRKGALAILAVVAGCVGSVMTWVIGHFGG